MCSRHRLLSTLLLVTASVTGLAETEDWNVQRPPYSVDAREVTLDVEEGTWMSLDVSPDGGELVFDLLGDLYRLPIEGGDAIPLTRGHAWDMQPRYNPDGKHIAFTSDRDGGDNIWVLSVDSGELRQITHETFRLLNNPTWSPDGTYIAARKHFTTSRSLGTGEIWLYHAGGNDKQTGRAVVERPNKVFQKEQGEPAFAPDGKSIYFTLNTTPGNTFIYHQDSNGELFQIRKVRLSDGTVSTVAGGPGGAVRPTPSPDGRRLAYVKRVRAASRLFVMDLDSGVEMMVDDELDQDMQEAWAVHGLYPNMDWTPDSKHLLYWSRGKLWKLEPGSGERQSIPFRVRDTRTVYPAPRFPVAVAPDEFATRMVRFARTSPDGKNVVFESLGHLYIKRGDAAPTRLVTEDRDAGEAGFDYSPVWSPDGRSIYFLNWNDQSLSRLYRVDKSGGKPVPLPLQKGQYTELAISPDGSELALRKREGEALLHPNWGRKPGIYLISVESGTMRFVSERGKHPHFGPDRRIYAQERSGKASGRGSDTASTRLISLNRNGNDIRELATARHATDIRLAPDGRHVAFLDNYRLKVAAFTETGKPLPLDTATPAFPTVTVSKQGGNYLHWSGDGRRLSWSIGPTLHTKPVDEGLALAIEGTASDKVLDLSIKVKADRPDSRLALTNARLITMDPERRVIENGTILIDRNRITAVGEQSAVAAPEDYTVIDLSGKTVIPGLVDIHAHGPYGSGAIIPQQNWNLLAHLALGVTTVHNPSSRAELAFATAEYVRAGVSLGPRIFSTGEIIYGAKSPYYSPVDSLDDALAHVRRLKAQGAITVKNYNQPRREQRQQVIEAARREGLMTVAEGGSLFHQDMNLVADGTTGVEHNVPTLIMYDDVTQLWGGSDAGYTPTLVVTFGGLTAEDYYYQKDEVWKHPILSRFVPPTVLQPRAVRRPMAPEGDYRDDDAAAAAKVLLEAGVTVNTGAHGQREGLGTHWEMWSFTRGGFTPMQALSAATINPATYLGMAEDIGSIEAGKLADLVILEANPLSDIRHSDRISDVVLNGRVYDASSLHERFSGDRRLKLFYWADKPASAIR